MKLAIVHSTGHVWFGVTSLTRLVQISTSPQSSAAMKIKYGALVSKITLAMQANRLPATQLISRKLGAILPRAPAFFFFSLALLSVFPFLIGCCNWLRCHLCCWVGRCVFPRIYPLPCQHFELSLALLNIFLLRICRYDYAIFCFSLLMECAQPLIRADVCK